MRSELFNCVPARMCLGACARARAGMRVLLTYWREWRIGRFLYLIYSPEVELELKKHADQSQNPIIEAAAGQKASPLLAANSRMSQHYLKRDALTTEIRCAPVVISCVGFGKVMWSPRLRSRDLFRFSLTWRTLSNMTDAVAKPVKESTLKDGRRKNATIHSQ